MHVDSVRKRGWVKNAAIIFLLAMLILVFVSNTIMNHGLPEVAAQYSTSGTITARIRGSGTVVANEVFDVELEQSRLVSDVFVSEGDTVERGDVLMTFAGTGTEDLDSARETLHELEVELERMMLEDSGDEALVSLRRAVLIARDVLATAQRDRNAIPFNAAALATARSTRNNANAMINSLRSDEIRANANLQTALDAVPTDEFGAPDETHPNYAEAIENVRVAQERLLNIQISITDLEIVIANASETIHIQEGYEAMVPSADDRVRDAQRSLDFANEDLAIAQREDPLFSIRIREQERSIELQREEVERLEGVGILTEIISPISGVVTFRRPNLIGDHAPGGERLIGIEVTDRGYSLSFPVTAEQSTRVSIGDNAEVDRGWWSWGEEITAILTSIRTDPQNPATGRLLEFTIRGDVESGTQLNLILNQRSENFQVIVPNSAVRTDTNGDFVLVVVSHVSPLRTRFIATRADVNVLASDDTHSAVTGGLVGWDFVITHSTRPIEPGMQVQLVANP